MMEFQNKMLVVLDGSERSFKTIEYLCDFKPFIGKEIALFNVFSSVPESYWDIGKEAFSRNAMSQAKGWELQRRKEMENYMERAKSMLVGAGYPEDNVTISIQTRDKGRGKGYNYRGCKGIFCRTCKTSGIWGTTSDGHGQYHHQAFGKTFRRCRCCWRAFIKAMPQFFSVWMARMAQQPGRGFSSLMWWQIPPAVLSFAVCCGTSISLMRKERPRTP